MANNLNILLAASIQITDVTLSPPAPVYTRQLNNPILVATIADYVTFAQITGTIALTLPAATCFWLYVRNLNPTTASGNIQISWTPTGGSPQVAPLLLPQGLTILCNVTETAGGFTAVSLTASAGTVPVEYVIGS